MEAHDLAEILARPTDRPYVEFIRSASLSVGLYVLEAGGIDRQRPHGEDEVYFVISGRGRVTVDGEARDVGPGATIYVSATVDHHFHDIAEELRILVVFAPPEGSSGLRGS